MLIAIVVFGRAATAQDDIQTTLDSGVALTGQTVIMGTWIWDIERNQQKKGSLDPDVWWQQVNEIDQFLVPVGRSKIAVMEGVDYHSLSAFDLQQVRFLRARVPNHRLVPGAVLALRTTDGNLAKIRVIGYRDLHDESFDDARQGSPCWFDHLRSKPNRPNYHLEIEWTLYSGRQAATL